MVQKEKSVPRGTIDWLLPLAKPYVSDQGQPFDRPFGTERSLKALTQHFVLGYYLHCIPPGRFFEQVRILDASATPALLSRFLPISHKKPSEELQFQQFRGSFRILTFLTKRLAVAVARKGVDSS